MKYKTSKLKLSISLLSLMLIANFNLPAQGVNVYDNSNYNHNLSSGTHSIKNISFNGITSFNLEYRGEIEVNSSDTDITGISAGGYLEISKTTFGSKRSIIIESVAGKLKKEYYEGRNKVEFEPDGKKWLAEILPDLVRSSGIAAKSRIERFYKQGGVSAVMSEISRLDGSSIQFLYGKLLLQKDGLSDADLINSLNQLSREIDSDYYFASLLEETSDKFLKKESTSEAYFEAVSQIDSDYYAAQVLVKAFSNSAPSEQVMSKIMMATQNIESDYYQASVLEELMQMRDLNSKAMEDIIKATRSISSDYYQAQILSKAMEKDGLTEQAFSSLMESASELSSDYYMAEVFEEMLNNKVQNEIQIKVMRLMNDNMSSDYYRAAILSKMVTDQNIEASVMEELSNSIAHMSSANYAASVIEDASRVNKIDKKSIISLIKACEEINSDYYISQALESLAVHVRNADDDVKRAYREAAKHIHSDTYYGRAVKAID